VESKALVQARSTRCGRRHRRLGVVPAHAHRRHRTRHGRRAASVQLPDQSGSPTSSSSSPSSQPCSCRPWKAAVIRRPRCPAGSDRCRAVAADLVAANLRSPGDCLLWRSRAAHRDGDIVNSHTQILLSAVAAVSLASTGWSGLAGSDGVRRGRRVVAAAANRGFQFDVGWGDGRLTSS
jgi:hypothetical protein